MPAHATARKMEKKWVPSHLVKTAEDRLGRLGLTMQEIKDHPRLLRYARTASPKQLANAVSLLKRQR